MKVIRIVGVLLVVLLPMSATAGDSTEQALARYEALQQRISAACQSDPEGDLCQVYLHGVLQGVESAGRQVEHLSAGWAQLHERADRQHPYAWLARDILHAASCSPDALAFLQGFRPGETADVARQANDYVGAHCQPVWAQHRLEAPRGQGYILTQR